MFMPWGVNFKGSNGFTSEKVSVTSIIFGRGKEIVLGNQGTFAHHLIYQRNGKP